MLTASRILRELRRASIRGKLPNTPSDIRAPFPERRFCRDQFLSGLNWTGRKLLSNVLQEKYEQVRNLINLGKDRGFLLLDEVNEILPAGEHSAEENEDQLPTLQHLVFHLLLE